MRENWGVRLAGARVALVPYRRAHVARYHQWMQDPFLLEMTASEPLSEAEELEMQASWRDDPGKCTFIVLDASERAAEELTSADLDHMVGDVNLFFNDTEDPRCAEVEVMIAEPSARRKGLASEAVRMIVAFARDRLGTERLVVKIGETNEASLALFERLGFARESFCDTFKEHTLRATAAAVEAPPFRELEDREAEGGPVYEQPALVDQYLALHFGQAPAVVEQTVRGPAPAEALEFPKRCAQWLVDAARAAGAPPGRAARVLDVGCAVGGASFELSKTFGFVRGVDNSASFVAAAKQVRNALAPVTFSVQVEGAARRSGIPVVLDAEVQQARVEFSLGDACALDCEALGGPFDAALLGNLLCRVPDPEACLRSVAGVLKAGAVVAVVSPFSWMTEFTEQSKWLQSGEEACSEARLEQIMSELGFTVVQRGELPLLIREHERKYQYVISSAVAFQKPSQSDMK